MPITDEIKRILSLSKAWIVFWKEGEQERIEYAYLTSEEEFERFMERLDKKAKTTDINDVCCLIPNDFYIPYYVENMP